ncbi:MAG: choice-of-anchor Q domain-containing protein, partial [Solirubrobacterales bacterium]
LNGPTGTAQCSNNTITNDHSLASDESCGAEAALKNKTPLLQTSLSNDGGSTTLYSEKAGSPTIDAGDTAGCPATDQRGYPRPDVTSTACDIGADEYSPTLTIIVPAEIVAPTTGTGAVVTYNVEATDPESLVKELTCAPASGSTFANGTTVVKCKAKDGHENTAEASFNVRVATEKHTLNVAVTGGGEGTVTSAPAGIECGQGYTKCSAEFIEGTAVKLTPTPAAGSSLKGWSEACTGTGPCSVKMGATNVSVIAEFSSAPLNTVPPAISGTPIVGQTLTATDGTWTGSPTEWKYEWEDCEAAGGPPCVVIATQALSTKTTGEYTLTHADIGHAIRVLVTAKNTSGNSAPAESAATVGVGPGVAKAIVVEGVVPFTQTLATTCSPVVLGPFAPGTPADYMNTCGLKATSTAAESKLVAEDTSATDTGHLVQVYKQGKINVTYELPYSLETKATSPQGGVGSAFASLEHQVTLLTYLQPFSEDEATVTFSQQIGLHDHLHTGTYAKTITITLSTTEP